MNAEVLPALLQTDAIEAAENTGVLPFYWSFTETWAR